MWIVSVETQIRVAAMDDGEIRDIDSVFNIEFNAMNRLSYQFFITYNLHKSYLLCQLGRGLSFHE